MSDAERKSIWPLAVLLVLVLAVVGVYLTRRSEPGAGPAAASAEPAARLSISRTGQLQAAAPTTAEVFQKVEFEIRMSPELAGFQRLPGTQLHDAYDADRNGVFIDLAAVFSGPDGESMTVPAFAVRDHAHGRWQWRVRWSPPAAGEWSIRLRCRGRSVWDADLVDLDTELSDRIKVTVNPGRQGSLTLPGPDDNPGYLRLRQAAGGSRASWQFGACRAWVVDPQAQHPDWAPDEWLDRRTELLPNLQAGGFNLLNQWMAPWEFLLVHHDRAEHWRRPDGSWQRLPLPNQTEWSAYQYYDQGRAAAFDELVTLFEATGTDQPVRLLLSPLPHQCFQMRAHPWGGQESGFSPQDDGGRQSYDRLNGFSGFRAGMSVWDFFEANPQLPLADWRCRLFDHQANFMRYLIARWGYSPAIGLWVLIDELDGVGDEIGSMADRTGWWRHPQCDRWLTLMVQLFKGRLARSDGTAYLGDPFKHPLHAATTSAGGQEERGGNLDWQGGSAGRELDVLGWHWYPGLETLTGQHLEMWDLVIRGVINYANAPGPRRPRLMSEFGAIERHAPLEELNDLYPTMYHHAIWAGVFSGLAGTPMDWDDGKEFGELRWRERRGIFDQASYPIDHVAQMQALRRFLRGYEPATLHPANRGDQALKIDSGGGVQVLALHTADRDLVLGWLFAKSAERAVIRLQGLPPGEYSLRWFDPWTGLPVAGPAPVTFRAAVGGVPTAIRAAPILRHLQEQVRARALTEAAAGIAAKPRFRLVPGAGETSDRPSATAVEPFPEHSRQHQGHDVAFRIERRD